MDRLGAVVGAVALAFACWAFTFGLEWGNFWAKIGISVACVVAYSLRFKRPEVDLRLSSVLVGLGSAVLLYGVFWAGNALAPYVVPGAGAQVGGIYELGDGSARLWVFLLLLLVTGPGEEVFWRGYVQDTLMRRWGPFAGFAATTAVYGAVHVFSGNLMLILAALVAGVFWGLQYLWRRDLLALMVSHAVWSSVIFAVLPVR